MKFRTLATQFSIGCCLLLSISQTDALAARLSTNRETQSDIGLKGLGFRLGIVDPEGALDETIELGVVFEFGELIPQLKWDGSLSFWRAGRNYRYWDNNHNDYRFYDWKLQDIILRTGVNYYFLGRDWVPFVGGGLGVHFYSWDYNNAPAYNNSDESKIGVYLDGGIERTFSDAWTGQLLLQFDSAELDQTAILFNLIHRFQ
jgi:hypothetical protein